MIWSLLFLSEVRMSAPNVAIADTFSLKTIDCLKWHLFLFSVNLSFAYLEWKQRTARVNVLRQYWIFIGKSLKITNSIYLWIFIIDTKQGLAKDQVHSRAVLCYPVKETNNFYIQVHNQIMTLDSIVYCCLHQFLQLDRK